MAAATTGGDALGRGGLEGVVGKDAEQPASATTKTATGLLFKHRCQQQLQNPDFISTKNYFSALKRTRFGRAPSSPKRFFLSASYSW